MLTSAKTIMNPLTKYWSRELLYFRRQRVEIMKKMAAQMTNLFRRNMPPEQSIREMKLAESCYYCCWYLEALNLTMFLSFFLDIVGLDFK